MTTPTRAIVGATLLALALCVPAAHAAAPTTDAPASAAPAPATAAPAAPAVDTSRTLRVATKPFEPFSYQLEGTWVGFSIDLWEAVARELGVRFEWLGTDSVTALLDAVRSGRADVGIAGITITLDREDSLDFTFPFYESGLQILVPAQRGGGSLLTTAILPALLKTVGFGLLIIIIFAHLIWLFERKHNPEAFPPNWPHGMLEGVWWAGVTLTTVGYGDRVPLSTGGRVIAFVWMFSGIVLISAFTASITTALTVQRLEGSISGPEDLPGRPVGTVKGSTAAKWIYDHAAKGHEYETIAAAEEALEAGDVEAVVYDSPVLLYYASHDGRGSVEVVGPIFERQSYGIALPTGSPMREPVNKALLKLRESGVYGELYEKWFGG
ncbi:MAG: transporter substrate-binding domain-containing protein [Deltaproteobacteria bacterium]|nr:transporter substrate-binding domain-containing protein [Deltaproteobacteria bacterium]